MVGGCVLVCCRPTMLLGGSILLWGKRGNMHCVLLFGTKSTMSGPHSFTVRRRQKIRPAGTEDMSLLDAKEFQTGILYAGARLASLVVVDYPNACLINNALFGVMEVVECYGLKGRWVTSWASSAHNEYLATDTIREVSGCVVFIDNLCKFCVVHLTFVKDYFVGGD